MPSCEIQGGLYLKFECGLISGLYPLSVAASWPGKLCEEDLALALLSGSSSLELETTVITGLLPALTQFRTAASIHEFLWGSLGQLVSLPHPCHLKSIHTGPQWPSMKLDIKSGSMDLGPIQVAIQISRAVDS